MKAESCFSASGVALHVLVVLCAIHHVEAVDENSNKPFLACDNYPRTLKCENTTNPIICITSIRIGLNGGRKYCGMVPQGTPNNNCTNENVKSYIRERCNGEKNCVPFKRNTDISQYCAGAFKYAKLIYDCVTSRSKCSKITYKPSPSPIAYSIKSTAKISTTKPPKTTPSSTIIEEVPKPTSQLNKIPATTAHEPGNETRHSSSPKPENELIGNFSSTSPGPHSRVPHVRKMCTRITTSASVVTTFGSILKTKATTKPTIKYRGAGYSHLNSGISWKFYVVVVASFIAFSLQAK